MQSSIVMRATPQRPLTPMSPTREHPGTMADIVVEQKPAYTLPPPPTSDLDQVPLTISTLEDPEQLRLELIRQVYGEAEDAEERDDREENSTSDFEFVPPLRTDAHGKLCLRGWSWEKGAAATEIPLALVARRRDDDPRYPDQVVGLLPIAVRKLSLRGADEWVALIGQPAVDTLELPAEARPAVRRRLIEAAELRLRSKEDPVATNLGWMLHRTRAGNPDGIQTAEELTDARIAKTGRPIPDGELALGWERLRTLQLRIELGLPLHKGAEGEKGGATAVLRRLQPEGAPLAQAETMLPKALEVRPLPLALPAGGAGWATRWGCGLDGALPAWQEVWRRARVARTAYSAECHLDGTLDRHEDGIAGGWPTAAAAAGVFGRLDKARVDGWAVVIPADRTNYASSANRKPNAMSPPGTVRNPYGDPIPAALDCRGEDEDGRGGGWPAFPRIGAISLHLPSGECIPPPPPPPRGGL